MPEINTHIPESTTSHSPYVYGEEMRSMQEANFKTWQNAFPELHEPWVSGEFYVRTAQNVDQWNQKKVAGQFEMYDPIGTAETDQYLATSISKRLDNVRTELSEKGIIGAETMSDVELSDAIHKIHKDFINESELRSSEIESAKTDFIERIKLAIDSEGLPLTHDQLEARLEGVHIGFRDPYNTLDSTGSYSRGGFVANQKRVFVATGTRPDELKHTVFHELLHAVSGARYIRSSDESGDIEQRKSGLEQPNENRLWLNEAMTDILADILLDSNGKYNFGSEKRGLWERFHSGVRVAVMTDYTSTSYGDYKKAAIDAFRFVPAKTLLSAYFAQDHDKYETDQMAGTHAERDLQRAIKVMGGAERIRQMRFINKLFDMETDERSADATFAAKQIAKEDYKLNASPIKKMMQRHKVKRHSKQYQAQIERAKQTRVS